MAHEATAFPARPTGFRGLMRNRDYALLWTSQGISLLGDRFHWLAISLWVYARTGSALSVSYAIIALMLGPAAVGLFAGVLVDRWNRKWTMILADIVRAILVALIPWLMNQDIRLVYVDLFLISCATAFFRPAMLATIPQVVRKSDLMPANSFLATIDTTTEVLGPIIAGVVVHAAGYTVAMYVDAGTYLISALILVFISTIGSAIARGNERGTRVLADIKVGFTYIRSDRIQMGLLALILLGWWVSALNSLQTPLAKGAIGLSDREFGWFNGVWGMGFLAASLVLGWWGSGFPSGRLIAIGFLGWAIATGVTGLSANAGMLYAAILWVGVTNIILFISLSTVIMQITPQHMLGRVITSRQVALAIVRVFAMLLFGGLADLVGVRLAILGMAGVSFLGVCGGFILYPEVLSLGQRVPAGQTVALAKQTAVSTFGRLADTLLRRIDPVYGPRPQRQLNAAVLGIMLTAWAILFFRTPGLSVHLILIIIAAVAFKVGQSRWATLHGSKNVRPGSSTRIRREFQGERRSPVATGPTPE